MAGFRLNDPAGAAKRHVIDMGAIEIGRQAEGAGDNSGGSTARNPGINRRVRCGARAYQDMNALGRVGACMGIKP
jgi:hypothetical protein